MNDALLLSDLSVTFDESIQAVRGVSLRVAAGEMHALVGESGSGKSVTARSVLGLLPASAHVAAGRLEIGGRELSKASRPELLAIRGTTAAMVFQEPARHLNPTMTIGALIGEALRTHMGMTGDQAKSRSRELLQLVDLDASTAGAYPHELSGGMKQRALIALAISCEPTLLLADEPTTALDVTVQAQILALLNRIRSELNMGILLITHDLGLVQNAADTVSVMYAGRIVDTASADELFAWPVHPYTELLLESVPSGDRRGRPLLAVPGHVPDAGNLPSGCAFHPRCPLAIDRCRLEAPTPAERREGHLVECHRADERILGVAD